MPALLLSMLLHADPLTVLWPRIIPRSEADKSAELAQGLQMRLVEMARRVFPGRELDVRPKGERRMNPINPTASAKQTSTK